MYEKFKVKTKLEFKFRYYLIDGSIKLIKILFFFNSKRKLTYFFLKVLVKCKIIYKLKVFLKKISASTSSSSSGRDVGFASGSLFCCWAS